MPTRAVALLAEVELSDELEDRARRRLEQRAAGRIQRVLERSAASVIELPGAAVLALWASGEEVADAQRGLAAAARLREELAPLGAEVVLRGAAELVDAQSPTALLAGGLGALADLLAGAAPGEIAVGDEVVDLLPRPEPPADGRRGRGGRAPSPEAAAILERARGSAPAPAELPAPADERIAALFNARAWEAMRDFFAEGFRQVDHRARRGEDGWTRDDLVAAWRSLVSAAPDAAATVERRAAEGPVTLGVLRFSGTRGGRPFGNAHALLAAVGGAGRVVVGEVFAVGDRAHARERFDALLGAAAQEPAAAQSPEADAAPAAPADPWARHEAWLAAWVAAYDAHDLERLHAAMTPSFTQVDHRTVRGAGMHDRERTQTLTASSLELLDDLRAEAELLAVDGDRRVARIAYVAGDLRMTTYVLAELDGERVARADVYDDADEALVALHGARPVPRVPSQ